MGLWTRVRLPPNPLKSRCVNVLCSRTFVSKFYTCDEVPAALNGIGFNHALIFKSRTLAYNKNMCKRFGFFIA